MSSEYPSGASISSEHQILVPCVFRYGLGAPGEIGAPDVVVVQAYKFALWRHEDFRWYIGAKCEIVIAGFRTNNGRLLYFNFIICSLLRLARSTEYLATRVMIHNRLILRFDISAKGKSVPRWPNIFTERQYLQLESSHCQCGTLPIQLRILPHFLSLIGFHELLELPSFTGGIQV